MSILENAHDDMLNADKAELLQTGLLQDAEEEPSEGAALQPRDLLQTDPEIQVQPWRQSDATELANQSGGNEAVRLSATRHEQQPRSKPTISLPAAEVLSIGETLGVQTESDMAQNYFLDLIESYKTGRYLTDKIIGVEKHSGGGEPRAVIFHGDYKVVIMASMIVKRPNDLRGQDPNSVFHYLLTKRIGAEIDYVVKGIDPESGIAVGSRKEAMDTKRRHYYLTPDNQGMYRVYVGLCCEARVLSVIPDGIFVEIFGVDTYIPLRELSYTRMISAMGYYEPGNRVLVKIIGLKRDESNNIRVTASVKQVTANPLDKAIEKIEVGNNYGGVVTLTDDRGVFVKLDGGAECRCPYPLRARPPRGARVIVRISGIDAGRRVVWGRITYVTIPK